MPPAPKKSEIRDSEIRQLLDKVKQEKIGQYIKGVTLKKVRSFNGDKVQFDFPVTALIGPNGGGKSTIMGAAACAYVAIKPGMFFPKSSIGDDSMAEWQIEYEVIDKSSSPKNTIRRTARFRNRKWVRDEVLTRVVRYFGINRTVPAGEKTAFKKLTKRSFTHRSPISSLLPAVAKEAARILGKPLSAFKVTSLNADQQFYIGGNDTTQYSEFHFGAGESSVIRMVYEIEHMPENSLVLIEEIENGLHPVATRSMVEYLISVALRKNIQTIFTTHSDAALEPLPAEAIWASVDGNVQQGKLSVEMLRAVSGRVDRQLAIFVEDAFAREWTESMIRERLGSRLEEIGVFPVSGDGNAVKTHLAHKVNPAVSFKSLCIIDGDSQQKDDLANGIIRLPGRSPESCVFDFVRDNLDKDLALITVACQRAPERQAEVEKAIKSVSTTNRDPHVLFSQVGIQIGFVSESIVRGAFIYHWIRENAAEVDRITKAIESALASN